METTTENMIIEAALRLFSKKGFTATSIRDIAAETKLTSSSLYYYVEGKDQLLLRIMEKYLNQLNAAAHSLNVEVLEPQEGLKALISLHVRNHGLEKLASIVVDREYRSLTGEDKEKVRALRRTYEQIWQGVLQRGYDDGTFHFADVTITSYALLEMCTGVAHWYQEGGRYSLDEIVEQYIQMGQKMVMIGRQ